MKTLLTALPASIAVGLLAVALPVLAQTPDGETPAVEDVCDDLDGALFGLCNAYCEAMDCDSDMPQASQKACDATLTNFMKKSGGEAPPCVVTIPEVCDAGTDPGTGSAWVVCEADADEAWVSADHFGQYHAELICQTLGYDTVAHWGGTCGNVCGFCEGPTSCVNPGRKRVDVRAWDNFNCGQDALGRIICNTVDWICVNE